MSLFADPGCERDIASMFDAGHKLAEVEMEIDQIPFAEEDQRAGLWLFAWSYSAVHPAHLGPQRRSWIPEAPG